MNNHEAIRVSVITPTYNRLSYLKKLYESLVEQTCHLFQWIIVDDGSEDGTENWFYEIAPNSDFEVKYFKIENGGKHRALNFSQDYIDGQLVVVVDSDDTLTVDAIETIIKYWKQYKNVNPVMLIFQRGHQNAEMIPFDTRFKGDDRVTSLTELTNKGFSGDHCEVVPKNEFVKYSLPEFEGEKFMGEAWLWQKIGLDGQVVYINKVVYLCEYIEGGLTKSGRKMRNNNPKGGQEHAKVFMHPRYKPSIRIKNAILYTYYGRLQKKPMRLMMKESGYPALIMFSMLPSLFLNYKWNS